MRVRLVTGSRSLTPQQTQACKRILWESGEADIVIHGACGWNADDPKTWTEARLKGVDALADRWGRWMQAQVWRVPAAWDTCESAGTSRNAGMGAIVDGLRLAGYTILPTLAFPVKGGRGTQHCMRICVVNKIDVVAHEWLGGAWEIAA